MSETIPGGAYLAADGKTLVDSEGRPLGKEAVEQAQELAAEKTAAAEKARRAEQAQQQLAASALRGILLGTPGVEPEAADDGDDAKGKRGGKK